MKQVLVQGNSLAPPVLRAATTGTKPEELAAALAANSIPDSPPGTETPLPRPVRLALLKTATNGRMLTHVTRKDGEYLAHSLLDLPATTDAQTAIQTWGSTHWQQRDSDPAAELPELPYLPVAEVLDDEAVSRWLATPAARELLEFTLTALLTTPSSTRIVLGTAADDVARVVYAVTRVLPTGLIDDFTFSTYEADPRTCDARLIGHDPGSTGELPPSCFSSPFVGLHSASGRRSDLSREVPFARFAVDSLANRTTTELDALRGIWQRLGLTESDQFELVDRLVRSSGPVQRDEVTRLLSSPAVASWLVEQSPAMNQLANWAMDDRDFANGTFTRLVPALKQRADVLGKVTDEIAARGFAAIANDRPTEVGTAFDVLLPMLSPARAAAAWEQIPERIPSPASLSWPMRWSLLPRLARLRTTKSGLSVNLQDWLEIPADRLAEFLALDLPKPHRLTAARAAMVRASGDELATVTRALAAHPDLVPALLQPQKDDGSVCLALYESLLSLAPDRNWFDDVLAAADDFPNEQLNHYFKATLNHHGTDIDRLMRMQGTGLIRRFSGLSGLDTLGTRFLSTTPADLLNNRELLTTLDALKKDTGISEKLKFRIEAIHFVRSYLDQPVFDADSMETVAAALQLSPAVLPETARGDVFQAVVRSLAATHDPDQFQTQFEAAALHLGRVLAKDSSDFVQDLLRVLRQDSEFARDAGRVAAVLAVTLGAFRSPDLESKLEGLEPDAFALATDAAKAGRHRLLAEIDRFAEAWPKDARIKWGFLREAVRPPRQRLGRDLLMVAIGAVIASVAWMFVNWNR